MVDGAAEESDESVDAFDSYRQFSALEPDVLVLSVANCTAAGRPASSASR